MTEVSYITQAIQIKKANANRAMSVVGLCCGPHGKLAIRQSRDTNFLLGKHFLYFRGRPLFNDVIQGFSKFTTGHYYFYITIISNHVSRLYDSGISNGANSQA